MRRWFIYFVLVLVPLQFSWAAVGSYCQHETGAAAQHLGHHEHQHKADAADGHDADVKLLSGTDADCASCHACCATLLSTMAPLPLANAAPGQRIAHRALVPPSLPPSLPDRPNWSRHAT